MSRDLETKAAALRAGTAVRERLREIAAAVDRRAGVVDRSAAKASPSQYADTTDDAREILRAIEDAERRLAELGSYLSLESERLRTLIERVEGSAVALRPEARADARVNDARPDESKPDELDDTFSRPSRTEKLKLRVADATDVELADLYATACRQRDDEAHDGHDGRAAYWTDLTDAVLEEAVKRPHFGEEPTTGLSRKQRKARAETFLPLTNARSEHLSQ